MYESTNIKKLKRNALTPLHKIKGRKQQHPNAHLQHHHQVRINAKTHATDIICVVSREQPVPIQFPIPGKQQHVIPSSKSSPYFQYRAFSYLALGTYNAVGQSSQAKPSGASGILPVPTAQTKQAKARETKINFSTFPLFVRVAFQFPKF